MRAAEAFLMAGLLLLLGPASVFAGPAVHKIKIENMNFPAAPETVKAGQTVEWENADLVPHTVTADDGSFDSKAIDPGKTWSFRFKAAGEISYRCLFHPNMHAKLIVK